MYYHIRHTTPSEKVQVKACIWYTFLLPWQSLHAGNVYVPLLSTSSLLGPAVNMVHSLALVCRQGRWLPKLSSLIVPTGTFLFIRMCLVICCITFHQRQVSPAKYECEILEGNGIEWFWTTEKFDEFRKRLCRRPQNRPVMTCDLLSNSLCIYASV